METVVAYAHWIQGGTYKLMKDTSTDTMVSIAIDPNLRGNEGLVNRKKIALRRQSAVIYQFLLNVIPLTCFTQFRIHEKKYKYEDEADPTTNQCCGLTLLAMLLGVLKSHRPRWTSVTLRISLRRSCSKVANSIL